jgi:hypothetical protein
MCKSLDDVAEKKAMYGLMTGTLHMPAITLAVATESTMACCHSPSGVEAQEQVIPPYKQECLVITSARGIISSFRESDIFASHVNNSATIPNYSKGELES